MNYFLRLNLVVGLLALAGFAGAPALAQAPAAPAGPAAAGRATAARAAAASQPAAGWLTVNGPYRRLAHGVMQDVDSTRHPAETVQRHDVTELLYVDPNFEFAKDVSFRHQVWLLDMKYKPVRMIWADIPSPEGRMLRKQIWYIVYQVTNPGKMYRPVEKDDELNKLDVSGKLYKLETVDKPVRFTPVFTLETHNLLVKEKPGFSKAAVEQYLPIVLPAIRDREDPKREFLTSQEMAQREIRVGETLWGVATWQERRSEQRLVLGLRRGTDQRVQVDRRSGEVCGLPQRHEQGALPRNLDQGAEAQFLAARRRVPREREPGPRRRSRTARRTEAAARVGVGLVADLPAVGARSGGREISPLFLRERARAGIVAAKDSRHSFSCVPVSTASGLVKLGTVIGTGHGKSSAPLTCDVQRTRFFWQYSAIFLQISTVRE